MTGIDDFKFPMVFSSWRSPDFFTFVRSLTDNEVVVAVANGVFDLVHVGHIEVFRHAKEENGSLVIAALNSDRSARKLKGKNRPYMTLSERMLVVRAIRYVDVVVSFDEDTPEELLKCVKPHWLVKGEEYSRQKVAGEEYCFGRTNVPMTSYGHTTDLASRIWKSRPK